MNELVSIITPSYNTGKFIGETIESVLKQTYTNWEMLIVDDCSSDNTDDVVAQYKDPRIKYFKNKKNSGAAVTRNRAIREAKGRWIAFLDSDDLWKPEKLEKQIVFMEKNNYHFSCTGRTQISEDGVPTNKVITSPHHVGKVGMFMYCWPGCLGTMYDANFVGLIQIADLKKNNDYAIWLKVIKKCDFYAFDDILAVYRIRKKSLSHDSFRKLLKSHYELFHNGEKINPVFSLILIGCNLVCGIYKKVRYIKHVKE